MSPAEHRHGEVGDQIDDELITLIRRTADEETKAVLIVMHKIRSEFRHERLEIRELIGKGVVAYKTAAWIVGVIGVLVVSMSGYILREYTANQSSFQLETQRRIGALEYQLLEVKQSPPISNESKLRISVLEENMRNTLAQLIDLQHRYDDQERYYAARRTAKPK